MIINAHRCICKVPVILLLLLLLIIIIIINDTFSKNTQIPNFIKIRPVGAQVFHAGGLTDRQT
jgi:hypothetical protein